MTKQNNCDVLIIGSGAAGLTLALHLAKSADVVILSKGPLNEGSTLYAQGGIAAVFDENDSINAHIDDTLIAGAGLCDKKTVKFTTENAKACLEWLINQGVQFDKEKNNNGETRFHLTREGGHSHRRILHAADATGQAVQTTLAEQVRQHSRIRIFERYNAIDLICNSYSSESSPKQCVGAYIWNRNSEKVESIYAQKNYFSDRWCQ
jgi:L-aspartate oxidase